MTGCLESPVSLARQRLEETIERLVPPVEHLLQRVAPQEIVTTDPGTAEATVSVPLRFPDGLGGGRVVAKLFRYRDTVRLDVELEHNRVFARPDGSPSDRRCFLNDFMASATIAAGAEQLPEEFRRQVLRGVHHARHAVQEHNKKHQAPWNQMHVVATN